MKTLLLVCGATLLFGTALPAQEEAPSPAPSGAATAIRFDNVQLDQLLGPIALYPDALVALILPASTVSSEVVLAARYLAGGGDAAQIESQFWDDSVRALARYPDVLKWMDENLAWTKQLGEAFLAQPADVMNSVQRLRLKARAVGSLVDTPQQQVVVDSNAIAIVPAQPDVIYVPYYDPEIVYVSRPTHYTRPFFSFSPAYASGFWLSYNVDWHRRRVWCVDRPHRETHWRQHRHDRHRPSYIGRSDLAPRPDYYRPWTPRPVYSRPSSIGHSRSQPAVVRPRHHGSAVDRQHDRHHGDRRWERNYSRPAHATGERFPTQPESLAVPRSSSRTHRLPLADPLPHPLPSPLPSAQAAPAAPVAVTNQPRTWQRGHDSRPHAESPRSEHNRGDRGRFQRGTQNAGAAARPSVSAPASSSAPSTVQPAHHGFRSRRVESTAPAATQPAPTAPVYARIAPTAQPVQATDQPTMSRSSERRGDDRPRGHYSGGPRGANRQHER